MRRGLRLALVGGLALAFGVGFPLAAMAQVEGAEVGAATPDVVAAYFAIWNGGSVDALDEVVTADFRRHAGPGEGAASREELTALIATTRSIYDPFELRIDDHYAAGDGGAARGTFHGVHAEVRRVVEFPVMSVFRMRDGRLSEEWILGDNFLVLLGLGYQMTPPGFTVTRPGSEMVGGAGSQTTVVPPAVGALPPPGAGPPDAASAGVESQGAPAAASFDAPDASPAAGADEAERTLRRYIDVWNSGEVERLAELTSEDFQRHSAVGAAGSRRELGAVIRGTRRFYRDLRMEVEDVVASGDRGAMRARFVGTYGRTEFVIRATSLHMFELRDGRVTGEWVQGNTTDLWTSFGYRLAPPDAKLTPPPVEVPPEPFPAAAWGEVAQVVVADGEEPGRSGAATLRIESPVACRIQLDGREVGGLAAGGTTEVRVAPGRHRVVALSLGGSQLHDATVRVERPTAASVVIEPPGRAVLRPRDRTVEDLETGLMWQTKDNGSNLNLAQARAACEELDQGGHTDWRLPSIHELESLYREDSEQGGYDTIAGVLLSDCCPWTSTPHATPLGEYHWTYVFHMGLRYLQFEALPWHMRVLCVRDPRPPGGGG